MIEDNKIEILPCPFCGYNPKLNTDHWGKDFYSSQIKCTQCGGESGTYTHDYQAIEAWNKRWLPEDVYTIKISKEIIEEWNEPLDE